MTNPRDSAFRLSLQDERPGAWPGERFAFPLSPAQERMWRADRARPGNPAYNASFRWELRGPVRLDLLARTFDEIVRRHEMLRTTFTEIDGVPAQVIAPFLHLEIDFKDLRWLPGEERLAEMDRLCLREARRGFDLEAGPLVRVGLLQVGDDHFVLTFTLHHIVSDGWSIGVIMEELDRIYGAYAKGLDSPLAEPEIQYPDYVVWQREQLERPETLKQLDYWRRKLAGYRRLEVPPDFPRPAEPTLESAIISEMLPRELSEALKTFSHESGGTMFATSLAACLVLLSRYSGRSDLAVGSPLAGRHRPETENLVGLFLNHVIFRTSAEDNPLFSEFVDRVKAMVWEALANQDVPFETVLGRMREEGRELPEPLCGVNFICQREYAHASQFVFEFGGIRLSTMPSKSQGALYDLNFFLVEREAGWRLSLEYSTDLYRETSARNLFGDFRHLLEEIRANPHRRISDFSLPGGETSLAGVSLGSPSAAPQGAGGKGNLAPGDVYALPVSVAQERFWLLSNLFPGSAAFQLPACVRISGPLSGEILERSFQALLARHEILRTTFEEIDGQLRQLVAPGHEFRLPATSLEGVAASERESRLGELVRQAAAEPIDLRNRSGFRVRLFRVNLNDHVLIVSMHHIIADGWSQAILQDELWSVYQALAEHRDPNLPPLAIQYGDFSAWQGEWLASDGARAHLDFWTKRLSPPLPIVDLPTDHPPANRLASKGAIETLLLESDLTASLKAIAQHEHATPFMLMIACFASLLARRTGQQDMVIGSPVANRLRETEPLIGPFAGPLALRFDLSGDPTLRQALSRVREVVLDGFSHAELPFEVIMDHVTTRSVRGRNPLFQFYFLYQAAFLRSRQLPHLAITPLPTLSVGTSFEMQCAVIERAEGLRVQLEYNPDLYDAATMADFLGEFRSVLEALISNPDRPLSSLPLRVQANRASSAASFEQTKPDYGAPRDGVESALVRIWESVLGRGKIGIYDDFFDLGGHSLRAVRLLKQVEERLGSELPLASLLDASTIERQAKLVRRERGEPPSESVPVRMGQGTIPLFYLGGYPTFRRLTKRLSAGREFHSLGMGDSIVRELQDPKTLPSIAQHFVRLIRVRQPHGPYMFAGWCSHGLLALEIAQQLRAEGEKTALIVMIETPHPVAKMAYPKWKRRIAALQLKLSLARFEFAYLGAVKGSEAVEYVRSRIKGKLKSIAYSIGIGGRQTPARRRMSPIDILYQAADAYHPEPYPWSVLLMRGVRKSFGFGQDPRLGWGSVLEGLTVAQVPGDHFSIMGAGAEALSDEIRRHMAKSDEASLIIEA
ncbi:MAG TPA: condensation domain-containing protein [Candidatus Cybelea sp.]|nr:condensation domain-containing protein [Candidatus Cybelea sp.]